MGQQSRRLLGEDLAHVGKGLELERVAGGIVEEHGGLFADLALKADVGLNFKLLAGGAEAVGERLPAVHGEDDAEVRDGDGVAVDGVVVRLFGGRGRLEVRDYLMAEEIEVDPFGAAAAFRAAEGLAVEVARGMEVVDRESNVEGGQGQGSTSLRNHTARAAYRSLGYRARRFGTEVADTIIAMAPPVQISELVQIELGPKIPVRKPEWLKAKAPGGETFHALKKLARDLHLHTVCESAQCPNIGECWNQKAATFMMLGNLCTRRCGFCAVPKGRPEPIDLDEPRRVAFAVAQLGLAHAVITSVNRDDDNLGAARAFVEVVREIRRQAAGCRIEVLTPDFQGNEAALRLVVAAQPEILNHNIETVPRLYRVAKSGGRYVRSLRFLEQAKEIAAELGLRQVTKTGIIVGLGEEMHELLAVFRDLATRRVDILTIGQYLRPSKDHLVMSRFYTPDEFLFLKHEALAMGFRHVEAGPLVRSSYHAQEQAQSTGLA